jgi:hypothetical protein
MTAFPERVTEHVARLQIIVEKNGLSTKCFGKLSEEAKSFADSLRLSARRGGRDESPRIGPPSGIE